MGYEMICGQGKITKGTTILLKMIQPKLSNSHAQQRNLEIKVNKKHQKFASQTPINLFIFNTIRFHLRISDNKTNNLVAQLNY